MQSCKEALWSFNVENHYKKIHEVEVPETMKKYVLKESVREQSRKELQKYKNKGKPKQKKKQPKIKKEVIRGGAKKRKRKTENESGNKKRKSIVPDPMEIVGQPQLVPPPGAFHGLMPPPGAFHGLIPPPLDIIGMPPLEAIRQRKRKFCSDRTIPEPRRKIKKKKPSMKKKPNSKP